jgi:ribose-phosphate pyrophosphokinase
MADQIACEGRWQRGEVEVRLFPDGERYQRIITPIMGRDLVLVGGMIGDSETLELYDLACALVKYGARRLHVIVPYFGYSTMERAVSPGEVVTAKTRARILSVIPMAPRGNQFLFLDLHSEGIPHYLEGNAKSVHVYGFPFVKQAACAIAGTDFVLASTDAGRAKWVQSLGDDLGVPTAFLIKRRLEGGRTIVSSVGEGVAGRRVVIYDDMIRTGGSLLNAAYAYKESGAHAIHVITTHGIFPGDALERLKRSGLIESVWSTDSHPRATALQGAFLNVCPVASLFVHALKESV